MRINPYPCRCACGCVKKIARAWIDSREKCLDCLAKIHKPITPGAHFEQPYTPHYESILDE